VVDTISIGISSLAVAITPDGSRIYVTSNANATVTVIDTATSMVVSTIPVGFNPLGVVITPDGTRAYVEENSEFLNIIDTK
jgi:YVTN family beta-propeller protein